MILGIHHINIVVTNIKQAVNFFDILGFSVFEEKELSGAWIDKLTGLKDVKAHYTALKYSGFPVVIELLQYVNPVSERCSLISRANSIGIRHIAFKVKNIEKYVEKLKNHGAVFFSPIQTNPYGKRMAYLKGPEDIILELAEF